MTPALLADVDSVASFDAISVGLLILRVVTGLTVAAHGYNKFFGGGGIPGTAGWFDSMGMRPNGKVHAILAASTELGGGVLFAAGLLTPLAAAGIVGLMVVAGWTVHRDKGFFIVKSGWEYNLILAVVAIGVATTGPGRYSLDWVVGLEPAFDPNVGLAVSAGLGVVAGVGLLAACYRPPAPEPDEAS
ncbi:DoxX family protein [Iamia majanohamensis]|uniref:DoxX family protein n=1 Tax=Iamia majanohamensis TaxID=467976 RepID=A0AAE9Y6Y6_9ACTN|nr:DoxX family protein [Iamia majanohamensis]WCO65538.1 DoxX family protein [Iamia majanohamensis]